MTRRAVLIPGDGIGPELCEAALLVLDAAGARIEWELREAGRAAFERTGDALPRDVVDAVRAAGVALKGPLETPPGERSVNVRLRQELDLYACVRPCRSLPGVRSVYEAVDVVVVRENTEDMYTGIEFEQGEAETNELIELVGETTGRRIRDDAGISVKAISVAGTERIVRYAFELARRSGRRKVTAGHKANIMKFTDGLFLETAGRVALDYPDVAFEDRIIDALAMRLVQRPEDFDVLVLPNLYGDLVSELCAGLVGGPGVVPGANHGDRCAVFETIHGSLPRLAGRGRADPTAIILAGAMLLRHLGDDDGARRVEGAVAAVIAEGRSVTYDLKVSPDDASAVGTREMAEAVAERV